MSCVWRRRQSFIINMSIACTATPEMQVSAWVSGNAFAALRYPNYASPDPHHPPSLKFQIFLAGLIVLAVLSWPFWSMAGWLLLGSLVIFTASAIPFLIFAARGHAPVAFIALPMLLVAGCWHRDSVSCGGFYGTGRSFSRNRTRHTLRVFATQTQITVGAAITPQ